jgi:hypothetical protein
VNPLGKLGILNSFDNFQPNTFFTTRDSPLSKPPLKVSIENVSAGLAMQEADSFYHIANIQT